MSATIAVSPLQACSSVYSRAESRRRRIEGIACAQAYAPPMLRYLRQPGAEHAKGAGWQSAPRSRETGGIPLLGSECAAGERLAGTRRGVVCRGVAVGDAQASADGEDGFIAVRGRYLAV